MFWDADVLKHELVGEIDGVEQALKDASGDQEIDAALIHVEQFVFWSAFALRKRGCPAGRELRDGGP